METLVVLGVVALLFFVFVLPKLGNVGFWKIAAKYPEESWAFFSNHPDWYIGSPPESGGYCGPYKALNPQTQSFVNVYCTNLDIAEQSQKEFMKKYS